MSARDIVFDILAIDRASKVIDGVGDHAAKLGKGFGKLGEAAAYGAGIAASAGVAALGVALVSGVKDAVAYQTLANKTAAVIKSTGNAAHVSVKGLEDYAGQLESLSGIDEETILNGENVLLTFTNVQNRVGKGNDIFNQATLAATNMSAALGQDMQSSVIQLGKALNDPVKGITALSRVGVSFTEQQKKQIKTLVDSGHSMEAQKVILGELNKEFGGAAKAAGSGFAGSIARAKDAVGDMFRAVGMALLPVITKMANWFDDKIAPALGRFGALMSQGAAAGTPLRNVLDSVSKAVAPLVGWVRDALIPAFIKMYAGVIPPLKHSFEEIAATVRSHVKDNEKLINVVKAVGQVFTGLIIPVVGQVAKLIATLLGPAFKLLAEIGAKVVIPALQLIIKTFVAFVKTMVDGAAAAFGWIPGLGPKLKQARAFVDDFAARTTATLNGAAKNTAQVGEEIANGIIAGIKNKTPQVIGVANKLGAMAAQAAKRGAQVASPSKITLKVGQEIANGITVGIRAHSDLAVKAAKDLASQVANVANSIITKLDATVQAAQDKLKGLQDARAQLADAASSAARSYASILGYQAPDEGPGTVQDVLQSMADRLAKVKQFAANLASLRSGGLNSSTFQELLSGGVDQAGGIAALLAGGGAGAIAQANSLQGQINSVSAGLGNAGAGYLYDTQIKTAQAQLDSLRRQEDALKNLTVTVNATLLKSLAQLEGAKTEAQKQSAILAIQRAALASIDHRLSLPLKLDSGSIASLENVVVRAVEARARQVVNR